MTAKLNNSNFSPITFKFLSQVCGLIGAAFGVVTIVGWMVGWRILTSIRADYKPMAPNTALSFIILGLSLLILLTERKWAPKLSRFGATVIFVLSLIRFTELTVNIDLNVDRWIFQATDEKIGFIPVGQMALPTSLNFLFASVAIFLASFLKKRFIVEILTKALSGLTTFIGLVFSLGYIYGAPLLYGGATIPMALNTSVAFFFLGLGLIIHNVSHDILEQKQAVEALREVHDELESRVAERTMELAEANEALLAEINERKQTEQALRQLSVRHETILDEIPDIVMEVDTNKVYTWANPAGYEFFGDGVIGKEATDYFVGEQNTYEKVQPLFRGDEGTFFVESWQRRKDGEKRLLAWWCCNLKDVDGRVTGALSTGRDITERKRAEEALRESEEKFRRLTETTTVAMFIYQGTKLRYVNPMSEIFTGYTKEELLVMDFWELIHPDHRDLAKTQGLARQRGEEVPPRYEFKILTKNGEVRWADFTGATIEFEGRPAVLGTAYDITERKQTEDALRQSEEKYRSILENIEEGYCEVDLAGNFTFLNDSTCKIFGYPKEELMGMNYRRYTDEEDAKGLYQVFNKVYRTGKPHTGYDYQIIRKDGTKRYIETSASLLKDSLDKLIGFRGVIRDITDHKFAERALKESEERYRIAIEYSNDGVAINKGDLYLYVNQKFLEIFGYKHSEEILGKPLWITVHPDDRDRVMEFAHKRQAGEDVPSKYDFKGVRKDGDIVYIEASATKTIYRGEAVTLVYLRDITERKLAEEKMTALQEQLNQAQRMEAIGRLAGGVAHDFNNILTVIKGYAQLSLTEIKEGNPFWGNIKEINRSADRAADLTRQLLAFSRRQIMQMKVVDLNTILQNLDKMLRRVISEDIELVLLSPEDLGRVKVDPGQIEQVVMNLVVNARDAMPKGGKLTIETANVVLDEEYARSHVAVKPGPYVMLSVSDTGIGMTPEVRERLFEPFFTTKEMGKGTGLGLSTVYGIVKQSGGNIWVYSELGKGTTFKIYLPQVDEDLEELTEKVETMELPRGFETVLIVEDNKEVRKLAARILESQGYKVLEASQGSEALPLCKEYQEPIHLMLTDVVMPGLDGRRLAERAKSFHSEMKVLYMSGYTENTIIHHGVLEKGMSYIQKPFTVDGLVRRVREVLNQ